MLITLDGIDDVRNDNDVQAGIYAAADPIELSPNREPIPNASYAISQDPRYRSTTRGRIRNGVLTTDPADVRSYKVTNSIYSTRQLNRAVRRMTIAADGSLDGFLAGYSSVDNLDAVLHPRHSGVRDRSSDVVQQ